MPDDDGILRMVLDKLDGVRPQHGYHMARCPAHDDGRASLQVALGKDQPVVLICMAGCETIDVLAAIGLVPADICATEEDTRPKGEWTPHGEATAVYTYTDEDGKMLYQVLRAPNKQFPTRVADPTSKTGWRWRLGDTRRVLYRLDRLRPAIDAGEVIYVTEGEKDVHAVERTGHVATCNPGGAGKWRDEYSAVLQDAVVVIIADADKPGREHARQVAQGIDGVAAAWEICEAAEGKDVSDHLASGRTLDELVTTTDGNPDAEAELAPDLLAFVGEDDPPVQWVIRSLLERQDRLIWTGGEGLGKTTVIRQIAVCAAAGVQPFRPDDWIDPQSVLFIDCENRVQRSRRQFRDLLSRVALFRQVEAGRFRIVHRPDGINLLKPDGSEFLLERVRAYRPDLLVVGPLYKLHSLDANEEQAAQAIVRTLEEAIAVCGSALIVEAHSPHGMPRSLRPRGSSLFLAWPDYGYGIEAEKNPQTKREDRSMVAVEPWRGARENDHGWPEHLARGGPAELPWVARGSVHQPPPAPAIVVPDWNEPPEPPALL